MSLFVNTPDTDNLTIRSELRAWTVFRFTWSLHSVHCSLLPEQGKSVEVYFISAHSFLDLLCATSSNKDECDIIYLCKYIQFKFTSRTHQCSLNGTYVRFELKSCRNILWCPLRRALTFKKNKRLKWWEKNTNVQSGGGGLELRIAGSTIALPFKTRCHREGCEVGSYLPSTASQKLAGSTEIWTQIAGYRVQSANHYTMEPSSIKGECPSVFSVEITHKEALRKAADPLASVWCPKSNTGSPLLKARIEAGIFRPSV